MPRTPFDNRFLPVTTQRAIMYFYRARFANNHRTRYARRATELLLTAAQAGNISAASMLGIVYYEGWGVPADALAAAHWLHRAAAEHHPLACFNLAVLYDNGIGVAKNPNMARRYYTVAAEAGCPEAMYAVGSYYYWGHGVEPDYAKARKWFRRSARHGYATAMRELGRLYQRSIDGGRNSVSAIRWFREAITAGDFKAATWLGLEYAILKDYPQARCYFELAVEQNEAHAMYLLGRWAEEGWDALPSKTDARFWFRESAKQGHEKAAWRLAALEKDVC